jgi:hypothetical protein
MRINWNLAARGEQLSGQLIIAAQPAMLHRCTGE